MSWDKNTVSFSEVDSVINTLSSLEIPYAVEIKDSVLGVGINDGVIYGDDTYYSLRRLVYKDIVILEQIEKDVDCDTDDIIISHRFPKEKEPEDWEYIVCTDKFGILENNENKDYGEELCLEED